jgi:hypothetical protein
MSATAQLSALDLVEQRVDPRLALLARAAAWLALVEHEAAWSRRGDRGADSGVLHHHNVAVRNSSPCSRHSKCSVIFLSYGFFKGSGSFAIFIAIRRASSCVSNLAVDCRPDILEIDVGELLAVCGHAR